jgi:hypothetical protein
MKNDTIVKFSSKSKSASSDWSVKFGAVKSIDVSDVHFKAKSKPNPYIRGKRYQKLPGIKLVGVTNSEAY